MLFGYWNFYLRIKRSPSILQTAYQVGLSSVGPQDIISLYFIFHYYF